MKSRTKTALGLDIGSRHISAALVEKAPRGIRVVAAANGDLPAAESQPAAVQAKAMSRVFRKLAKQARISRAGVVAAVSTHSTIIRLLDLPRPLPVNVSEFIDAELNQYVALSGRQRQQDFCGVGMGSGSRKRLLAVAADAEEMGEVVHACRKARITVDTIEPAALAYARASLLGVKDMRHSDVLIAMLGARDLVMCLFCKGVLDFVRIRDLPMGIDSPDQMGAWLTEELDTVRQYHRSAVSSGNTEVLIRLVIHDSAHDKSDFVRVLAPDGRSLVVVDSREPAESLYEVAAGASPLPSTVAVGAALRLLDVEKDELRIDLMPRDVIRARSSSRHLLIAANVAAVVFLAVFLVIQFLARTTDAMNRRIARSRLDGQLYTLPAMVAEDRYLDGEISRIQRQLADLDAVRGEQEVDWPAVLHTIGQAAPAGACVTHLACGDGRRISLTGLATSHDQVRLLTQNLAGRGLFESVRPKRMERPQTDSDTTEYEIECVLKTVRQESSRDDI